MAHLIKISSITLGLEDEGIRIKTVKKCDEKKKISKTRKQRKLFTRRCDRLRPSCVNIFLAIHQFSMSFSRCDHREIKLLDSRNIILFHRRRVRFVAAMSRD